LAGSADILDGVKDLLKIGPRNLVGVDIGLSSVKVCELSHARKGGFKLTKFAHVQLSEGCLLDDEVQKPDEIITGIKEALKKANIKNTNATIGIFGPNCVSKRLSLPSGPAEEIEDQVLWESEQYIPFAIDDSTVDYHLIGENAGGGNDVLIAAALNSVVMSFSDLIVEAGLKVRCADLQFFALVNVFECCLKNELEGSSDTYVVIDFGAQKTSLVIYRNGSVLFSKEINLGGVMITEEIQREMGLSYLEAEDLKISGDENGNLSQEVLDVVNNLLESFFGELKKTLNFFMTASSVESIEHCYITGGASLVPGLNEGLQEILGIGIKRLNPLDKIESGLKGVGPTELEFIATSGCTAIGLAMRSLDE
jgi:type IV pilus assembly protein PilM